MVSREVKQESSISVQGRVSVLSLAELYLYWTEEEGIVIKSMSQMIGWSMDLLCEILRANDKLPESFESVIDAHRILEGAAIYQPSMLRKSRMKLATSIKFENLREKGIDPSNPGPDSSLKQQYNTLHKRPVQKPKRNVRMIGDESSVQPFMGEVSRFTEEELRQIDEINSKLEREQSEHNGISKESREATLRALGYDVEESKEQVEAESIEHVAVPTNRRMTDEEFEAKRRELAAHDKAQDEAMDKWLEEQDRLKIERTLDINEKETEDV